MKTLKEGVYRLKHKFSQFETLAYFNGAVWNFFGDEVDYEYVSGYEVGVRIEWETPRESYRITPDHPRASFMVFSIDGKPSEEFFRESGVEAAIAEVNLFCNQVILVTDGKPFSYQSRNGNKLVYSGNYPSFNPDKFLAVDKETGDIYAKWGYEE